jgi:hypothetical protein
MTIKPGSITATISSMEISELLNKPHNEVKEEVEFALECLHGSYENYQEVYDGGNVLYPAVTGVV